MTTTPPPRAAADRGGAGDEACHAQRGAGAARCLVAPRGCFRTRRRYAPADPAEGAASSSARRRPASSPGRRGRSRLFETPAILALPRAEGRLEPLRRRDRRRARPRLGGRGRGDPSPLPPHPPPPSTAFVPRCRPKCRSSASAPRRIPRTPRGEAQRRALRRGHGEEGAAGTCASSSQGRARARPCRALQSGFGGRPQTGLGATTTIPIARLPADGAHLGATAALAASTVEAFLSRAGCRRLGGLGAPADQPRTSP